MTKYQSHTAIHIYIHQIAQWLQNKKRPVCVAPCDYQKTPSSILGTAWNCNQIRLRYHYVEMSDIRVGLGY